MRFPVINIHLATLKFILKIHYSQEILSTFKFLKSLSSNLQSFLN